jgi:hypothetical protein
MSKRTRQAVVATTAPVDDLQSIKGVGPTIVRRLHEAGVGSYNEITELNPARLAELLGDVAGVSATRIAQQDWIGQARRLADRSAEPCQLEDDDPDAQPRYVTFHVELLVGPDDAIRRTQVRHHESGMADSWAGWEPDQLVEFLHERAAANQREPLEQALVLPPSPIRVESLGPTDRSARANFTLDNQPAAVQFTLVIDPVDGLDDASVDFTAGVVARAVGSVARRPVSATAGSTTIASPMTVELSGPPLPPGLYFLEADVAVYVAGHGPDEEPLCQRRVPGELIHVSKASSALAPAVARTTA